MEHLIPAEWFVGLSTWLLLIIGVVALAALIKGADLLVDGASGLAYRLGMSKVIVGATIVSLGTTSPECAVSVMAAWQGEAGLALGNAVGSIIADTGFIFGLGCLLTVLPADPFVLRRQGMIDIAAVALLASLCYGAYALHGDTAALGRPVGVLLLLLLIAYMLVSVRWSRSHPQGEPFQLPDAVARPHPVAAVIPEPESSLRSVTTLILFGVVGLAIVIVSSHVLVQAVTQLAERWGVPQVVIAGTIVAMGTSLPELVIGMTSIRRGHPELLVGNVIGADILNVLFVTGAAAFAKPLPIIDPTARPPEIFLLLHLPTMLLVVGLFAVFIFASVRRQRFQRWMGLPLVLIYVAYVAAPLFMRAA